MWITLTVFGDKESVQVGQYSWKTCHLVKFHAGVILSKIKLTDITMGQEYGLHLTMIWWKEQFCVNSELKFYH